MKKFIINVSIFISLFLVSIGIISFFGDADGLFYNKNFYKKVAEDILKGKYVYPNASRNLRLFQKEIIKKQKNIPNTIALGSSRIGWLSKNTVNDASFFNHGFGGCTLEDIAAILNLYIKKNNKIPANVILALDPWFLNKNMPLGPASIRNEYLSFFLYPNSYKDIIKDFISPMDQLFVPLYTRISLNCLIVSLQSKTVYQAKNTSIEGLQGILPDGSSTSSKNSPKYRELLVTKNMLNVPYVEDFKEIDNNRYTELIRIVEFLIKKKSKITFFLCPYHPKLYKRFLEEKKYKPVLESEIIFRQIAKKYNLVLKGSFDPFLAKISPENFIDGIHIEHKAAEKIFKDNL